MRSSPSSLRLRLAAVLCAAALVACGEGDAGEPETRSAMTITAAAVEAAPFTPTVSVMGTVVAWEEMPVGAEVGGLAITEVLVDEGDAVRKGQLLARLNDAVLRAELAQREASVASARATLEEARANLRRAEELLPKGHISGQTADARRATAETAAAQLALAEASRAETAAKLAQTRIVAPDDGRISARSAVIGQIVASGTELFRIVRQGRLELDAEIPEATLALLRPGLPATVSAEGLPPAVATIRAVAPSVDSRSRLGVAHLALPPDAGFRPGMFAQATISLDRATALLVPQAAIVYRDGKAGVFVLRGERTVRFVEVATGERVGELVEIARGLSLGEQVALKGAGFLEDGDQVTLVREPAGAGRPVAGTAPDGR
jgi:RND family efflux transporter MFP subunit